MSRFVSEIHLDAVIPVQVVDFANRRNDLFHAVLGLGALGEFLRRIPSNHGHATAFICFGGLCSPIREGHLRGRSATNGYEIGNEIARRVILSGGRVRVVPEGSTSQSEASRGDFALRRLGQHSREESATGLRVSSRSVRPDPIHADPVKAFCHETHPH